MLELLLRWILNAGALWLLAWSGLIPGFRVEGFAVALVAALVLAVVNLVVRPLVALLALPITCLTFGLFALVINAAMLGLAAALVDGFQVGGFIGALLGSLLFSLITTVLNAVFNPEK